MKKILTLFVFLGLFGFSGCSNDDSDNDLDNDTISYVFEVNKINFSATFNSETYVGFDSKVYTGDVVLVYRYDGADSQTGKDIWTPLPESHYYPDGTLYFGYKFDFTQDNVRIFIDGFGLNVNPIPSNFVVDQIFRIVIVPGDDGINMNKTDYYTIIEKINLDNNKIKRLN